MLFAFTLIFGTVATSSVLTGCEDDDSELEEAADDVEDAADELED
jgi:hypothetical protein